jgi:predicted RNA-binding Zn-ribbon protein involved in translation (DUF1610 family)
VRQRDVLAIVVIWGGVFTAAFVLAAFYADDNPDTDDASGAGALAAVAGTILTVLYFGVRALFTKSPVYPPASDVTRPCPHCGEQMSRFVSTCPRCRQESGPWTFHEGRWWTRTTDGRLWVLDDLTNEWSSAESDTPASPPSPQH